MTSAPLYTICVRIMALVLLAVGAWLAVGGARLLMLGGSWYYLLSGVATVATALLIWRGNWLGAWMYLGNTLLTVVWALAEVGLSFWLLWPRLGMPLVMMLLLGLLMWRCPDHQGAALRRRALPLAGALLAGTAGLLVFAQLAGNTTTVLAAPAIAAPTTPAAANAASEWRDYGRTKTGTRYVPAEAISRDNVHTLQMAWTYRSGDLPQAYPDSRSAYSFQATPLKVGDTLYVCTPRNIVIALEAESGRERWRHDPAVDASGVYMLACRGVAYHESKEPDQDCPQRIVVTTVDARMIALDAQTGERCPGFGEAGEISLLEGMGEVKPGYYLVSSPPAIVGDVAVVGGFVLDNMSVDEPPGVVRGFDVVSGRLLWAWDAGRPQAAGPWRPGEPFTRGSPNAWSLFSADEALGLVYIPTGNATPDYYGGLRSEAQERFSSSVVALDAGSGALRWAFQTVHHDLWDYDVASQPVLVDLPIDGERVPALIQPTKQGEIFLLDRRNGEPLAAVEEQPVPRGNIPGERYSPTQPVSVGMPAFAPPPMSEQDMWGATQLDQLWCRIALREQRYQGRFTPPGLDRSLVWPGNNGVMNWGSVSVDEERQLMAVSSSYMPLLVQLIPRDQASPEETISFDRGVPISPQMGAPYAVRTERPFMSPIGTPCNAPPWGRLAVVDLQARKMLWQRPLGTTRDHAPLGIPVPGAFSQGGSIITRGGLIFIAAAQDNYLRAFDVQSGKELWKGRLPAGGQATPMSFVSSRNGKQYVVIASGGHAYMRTTIGDYVVAFSLPD